MVIGTVPGGTLSISAWQAMMAEKFPGITGPGGTMYGGNGRDQAVPVGLAERGAGLPGQTVSPVAFLSALPPPITPSEALMRQKASAPIMPALGGPAAVPALIGMAAAAATTPAVIGALANGGGGVSPEGYTIGPTHADVVPGRLGIVNGVSVSGPGVPEPPPGMVAKQWSVAVHSNTFGTFRIFFFRLIDGRVMMYNPSIKGWKIWRPKKPLAVMYRGRTTLSQAVKVQKYLDRMWRQVAKKTKQLKMA